MPEIYNSRESTARKDYRCEECHGRIRAGDTYYRISGLWEGDFSEFFQCPTCNDLWDEVVAAYSEHYHSNEFIFGTLTEYLFDDLNDQSLEWIYRFWKNADQRGVSFVGRADYRDCVEQYLTKKANGTLPQLQTTPAPA